MKKYNNIGGRLFKKKNNGNYNELLNPKSNIEHLQIYAEKLMFESGIDIDNVHIHNNGDFGQAGICTSRDEIYDLYLNDITFNLISGKPYIIVPEITGWWSFRAWLHEIGHLQNKHYQDFIKPEYYQEFEAELYCIEMAMKCDFIDTDSFNKIKDSAIEYLLTFIEDNIDSGYFKGMWSIPEEVRDFIFNVGGYHYMGLFNDRFSIRKDTYFISLKKFISDLSSINKNMVYLSNKIMNILYRTLTIN